MRWNRKIFDVQFHVKYNDEVSKVGKSFNFMVRKIRQLIKEVYATKLLYKQTELKRFTKPD